MESRPRKHNTKPAAASGTGLEAPTAPSQDTSLILAQALVGLEDFLADDGQISLGNISAVRGAAVASDAHNMLAAIVQRSGETLGQLLIRLDIAVQLALEHNCFVDEINAGPSDLLP